MIEDDDEAQGGPAPPPGYLTPAKRRQWRKYFTVGLLDAIKCETQWIADAVSLSDTRVRDILKSETVRKINYSKFLRRT